MRLTPLVALASALAAAFGAGCSPTVRKATPEEAAAIYRSLIDSLVSRDELVARCLQEPGQRLIVLVRQMDPSIGWVEQEGWPPLPRSLRRSIQAQRRQHASGVLPGILEGPWPSSVAHLLLDSAVADTLAPALPTIDAAMPRATRERLRARTEPWCALVRLSPVALDETGAWAAVRLLRYRIGGEGLEAWQVLLRSDRTAWRIAAAAHTYTYL